MDKSVILFQHENKQVLPNYVKFVAPYVLCKNDEFTPNVEIINRMSNAIASKGYMLLSIDWEKQYVIYLKKKYKDNE